MPDINIVSSTAYDNKFTDIEEVTLNSKFYPAKQPFLTTIQMSLPEASSGDNTDNFNPSENLLEDLPQNSISLTFDRIIDGIGTFTISLFDPNFDEIEQQIRDNKGHILFRYGYSAASGDDDSLMSPWYDANIFSYKIKFTMGGSYLTFSGITGRDLTIVRKFDCINKDNKYKISDVVKKIATDYGYSDEFIEETDDILVQDGLTTTDYIHQLFNTNGESSIQFIIQSLLSKAVNKKRQRFTFFIKNPKEARGKRELHFHSESWKKNGSTKELIPAFTMFSSPNSVLIDFDPSWDVSILNILKSGSTYYSIIDANNKEQIEHNITPQEVPGPDEGGCLVFNQPPPNFLETGTDKDKLLFFSKNTVGSIARSKEELEAIEAASQNKYGAITATITIVGTPEFNLLDKIAVIVYIPKGKNAASFSQRNYHSISGYFRIFKITDQVEVGKFTTTFKLGIDTRNI